MLASDTAERIHLLLSTISCLARQALEDEISFIEPHTQGAKLVPRPQGVELGTYLDLMKYQGALVPANRTDRGFSVYAQLQILIRDPQGFSCVSAGLRAPGEYCARVSVLESAGSIKARKQLLVQVEVPAFDSESQDQPPFSFLPLFDYIRTAVNEPDGTILLALSGYWYKEIPFRNPASCEPPPLSDQLNTIAANTADFAGLTANVGSTAYTALAWLEQPQPLTATAAITTAPPGSDDAGAAALACQVAELKRVLESHAADAPAPSYGFLLVSGAPPAALATAVAPAGEEDDDDSYRNERPGQLCGVLGRELGECVELPEVFFGPDGVWAYAGTEGMDGALGLGGADALYGQDSAGVWPCVRTGPISTHCAWLPGRLLSLPLSSSLCPSP